MKQFIGQEDSLEKLPNERPAFFCGKAWKGRGNMLRKIEDAGIESIRSSQELRRGKPLTDDEYIHKMRTSKYGLVLAGRASHFTEPKNRREIDYMILKKPLLINYRPFYYDTLIEGKHYIHLNNETDFENLENMYNIEEIAENGYQWYKNNASPEGCVKSFMKIVNDKFHTQIQGE